MKNIVYLKTLISSFNACYLNTKYTVMEPLVNETKIVDLVKANDAGGVREALENGADVNAKDSRGRSLLLLAVTGKKAKIARILVAYGADVNIQDHQLDSPFLFAGANGQTEFVKLFLVNGARFDIFNRYNGTALIPACERGHVETVRILAQTKNFPINHVNRLGWTALMEAVLLGDGSQKYQQIVQILKDSGAEDIPERKNGQTALQHARRMGFTEIVEILEK